MIIKKKQIIIPIILCIGLLLFGCTKKESVTYFEDKVVAGNSEKFMEVHHVVIKGTNYEIGKMIGNIARKNGVKKKPSDNKGLHKDKREYMIKNYPVFYERMKGVADAYSTELLNDDYDFCWLPQNTSGPSGCSAVFYPGDYTENGHGILSRNFDFSTGNAYSKRPKDGELPIMARPYIFELYPDTGYASIAITAIEYLGGVLDGINSEGLTVAVFVDGESVYKTGLHPTNETGVYELLSMRYLLDNCKNVVEAKKALLSLKHYYAFMPCHYIIADKDGNSFIFERDTTYIIDGKGPQCITNHLVYNHQDVEKLPDFDTYNRYKLLYNETNHKKKFTWQEIGEINACVAFPPNSITSGEKLNKTLFPTSGYATDVMPDRTLWYTIYDTEENSLKVKFYLGEKTDPNNDNGVIFEYSDYLDFKLKKE